VRTQKHLTRLQNRVEHFRCKTTNIRLGYRAEWSTLQCRPTNIRLGYRTEWSILGADPKTLDLATEQSGAF
jgi:hypothetical protein